MTDVCCPDDDEPKPQPGKRTVKQTLFSHGRSNTVVVEVKRRRVLVPRTR